MLRRIAFLVMMLASMMTLVPRGQVHAADQQCFPTGYCISGKIMEYWQANGGLPVFGYPINGAQQELNRDTNQVYLTQWFERNRIEVHPEYSFPYDVLLGLLGKESMPKNLPPEAITPETPQGETCIWFPITQHNACNQSGDLGFKRYWETHGLEFDGKAGYSFNESLALFGYPLTTPIMVTNSSGDTVLTQWYERARFEWHPNKLDEFKVLLGRVGSEAYDPAAPTGTKQYHAVQQAGWTAPLEVPIGMTIEEAYSGLVSPRFMVYDPTDQSVIVADKNLNAVFRLRDTNNDGRYDQQQTIADGFTVVHSVALMNGVLYAADEHQLVRLTNFAGNGRAQTITKILDLPTGAKDLYGHRTRTVKAGNDGYLYVSIGSSCDVCLEDTNLRAAIIRLKPDGSDVQVYASGLRNTVDFAWRPYTSELWGVDMGRNNIGATNPPDELNKIEQGKKYGWPYCYGNNVPNPEFNDQSKCVTPETPRLNFPAHWSPLGFVFYDQLNLPATYQNDAIVAFHGSGADQVPTLTGYRVSRIRFEGDNPVDLEDLVRGWNQNGQVWGRPCGLLILPDGSILISDDFNGRIYRLRSE